MAIAEQFAGLQMDQLIGAPLRAAVDASLQLADSTADFIRRAGFDGMGKVRTVSFGYQRYSANEDGTSNREEMEVAVPLLAVTPIPNLQVDEVNLLFDIEVKQSERIESSIELNAGASGKLGAFKVGITGSVSAHQTHTRSTDNSAKYHVDIRAVNHGMPEGLARVLDMIAANMTPVMTGSVLKDGNGQELSGQEKERAERCKRLRAEIAGKEQQFHAAEEGLSIRMAQLKKLAETQLNVYKESIGRIQGEISAVSDAGEAGTEARAEQMAVYTKGMDAVRRSWEEFIGQMEELIRVLAAGREETEGVAGLFALKAIDQWGNVTVYGKGEACYDDIEAAQKKAVENRRVMDRMEDELLEKREEYSKAMQLPGRWEE